MITPIEIRQHTFRKKTLGGYDVEEVQQFLSSLSVEWEQMIESQRRLKTDLDKLQASYNSLKEVEVMINKTLHQAEQSTKDTLDNARKRATLIVNEAEAKAREIVRNGVEQRQNIDREITELCDRRDEILNQLQLFLKGQTERLAGFGRKNTIPLVDDYETVSLDKTKPVDVFNPEMKPINGEERVNRVEDIVEQL